MRCIITVFSIFLGGIVFAQGQLELTIVDEEHNPVEYAKFRLFSKMDSSVVQGGYSNKRGQITLQKVPYDNYFGVISFFSFENDTIPNIRINKNKPHIQLGSIVLDKIKTQKLGEVTIKGEGEKLSETSIAKRTYNVEKDMTAIGGSVNDVLRNIPSIDVDNEGNVSLRGNGSVTILIDGRPSVISSTPGGLNGIPASAIKKIEVITNPSAKYNPDGTAGIINIILKKQKLRGFNLGTQFTAGSYNLYNGGLNFNYRNEKINIYANYSFRYREGERNSFTDRTSLYNDTTEFLNQVRYGTDLERSHTGKVGIDFFLKENQTLGLSASGRYTDRIRKGKQRNELNYNGDLNQYWNRILYAPRNRRSIDLNANYKLDFEDNKGNLMLAITESIGRENNNNHSKEYYYHPNGTPLDNPIWLQNQDQDEGRNKWTISSDLTRNINKNIKYQLGLQAIIHHQSTENYLESLDTTTGVITPDVDANNIFDFQENIFSAYGTFGQVVTSWFEYQAGIRIEQAFTTPYLVTTEESFENDYFSFFPSLHLAFGNDTTGQIYASYSRRINRPDPWNLNPFPMRRDPRNIRMGNPALDPEYINSYELGYQKDWRNFNLTGTVYFKETVNKIQRIRQFLENQVSVSTYQNIDRSYDYGAELILSYSPFPWWDNMLSANAYERRLTATYQGTELNNKGISWDVKLNTTFSFLDNTTKIQINAKYYSKRYNLQGYYQFQPGIDIGITRTLLDKNLVIGARISDLFNQRSFRFVINDRNRTQHSKYKWTSRRVYLTISYKFGNLRMHNKNKELRGKIQQSQEMAD